MSLQHKLTRMKKHIIVESNEVNKNTKQEKEDFHQHTLPYQEIWETMGAIAVQVGEDIIIKREVVYPLEHQHGSYRFKDLYNAFQQWQSRNSSMFKPDLTERVLDHPLTAATDSISELLFFDTETTGLGSGTGHYVFLLGYAFFTQKALIVRQLFLPTPVSEKSFYLFFLEELKSFETLLTYNGKSFDWPQVKTRHTLHRQALPPLPSFKQVDLLHSSRRLWKNSLPSCRMPIIEEEILNYKRVDDTGGYLAPIYYFDYLQTLNPTELTAIFRHNEWDVCSLVTLYTHQLNLLMSLMPAKLSEQWAMAKWSESIGDDKQSMVLLESLLASNKASHSMSEMKADHSGELNEEAAYRLALLYKRNKKYDLALRLWQQLTISKAWGVKAHIALAKWYEHDQKDFAKAYVHTQQAFILSENKMKGQRDASTTKAEAINYYKLEEIHDINKRLERLKHKLSNIERESEQLQLF